MKDAKEMEREFNAVKHDLLKKTVTHGMSTTRQLVDKTKDTDSAMQMASSGMKLHNIQEKIDMLPGKQLPDIKMKGGTGTPIAEPSVTIRGIHGDDKNKTYIGYMAKTMYVPLSEDDKEIHVIFETKNVKLDGGGYRYRIFAKEEKGRFNKELVIEDNNRFNERSPNILINMRLPPAKYDIFVLLYENNSNKKIVNSKDEQILDYARIEIKPSKTYNGTGKNPDPSTDHDGKTGEKHIKGEITEGERKKRKFKKEDIEPAKIVPHKELEESDSPKEITKGADYPVVSATPLIEITMHDTIEGDRPQPLAFTVHNANMYGRINFDYTIDIWTLANPVGMILTTNKFVSHDYSNLFHEESSINIKRTDIDLSRINPQFTDNGLELPKLIVIIVKDNNTGHIAKHIRKILVAHSSVNGAKLD